MRRGGLALDPFLSICGNLFFPDGYSTFECVDNIAACLECFGPVRSGNDNNDAGLSYLQASKTVCDGDSLDSPALLYFLDNCAYLLFCHLFIYIVLQIAYLFATRGVAYHALKDRDAAHGRIAHGGYEGVAIQWC